MGNKDSRRGNGKGKDPEHERRERFARALAKAEFGRFYWDDKRESDLRADRRVGRKRPKPS